jgi:hypothetical protein
MKKKNFIERNLERMVLNKAVEALQEAIDTMEVSGERLYLNVFNTGFLIDTTKAKRKILDTSVKLLKNQLKKR